MASHLINDHLIEVPADMGVSIATHQYPGDYDCIVYRGFEISTFETDEPEGAPYLGAFVVAWDHKEEEIFATLDQVRDAVDALLKESPMLELAVADELAMTMHGACELDEDFDPDESIDSLGFSAVM